MSKWTVNDIGDLSSKNIIITGANSGTGFETAKVLAAKGATIIMACRSKERGERAKKEIHLINPKAKLDLIELDLASLSSIDKFVVKFKNGYDHLDVLINNAGIVARERQLSEDGIETTFAVNHLAPFLLTNLLLPMLKATAGARIVTVASQVHGNQLDFDNLQSEKRFHKLEPYKQSKLANILFTFELARRLAGTGVTANCLHPGVIRTGLLDNYDYMRSSGNARSSGNIASRVKGFLRRAASSGTSTAEGAKLSVYLATSPDVAAVTGKYFLSGKEAKAADIAYDEVVAQKLWQVSETLTGVVP